MSLVVASDFVDVDGPVHVADLGGPADAPVVLCVHGLAGSHAGWARLAQELVPSHRVLAVDLPGHGRSPAAGREVTVADASRVVTCVLRHTGAAPVTLVGHSMGAAVSVLVAAAAPELVERLVLLAPPMPRDRLRFVSPVVAAQVALCLWPRAGQAVLRRRLARHGVEKHVHDRLRLTCGSAEVAAELAPLVVAEYEEARAAGEDPVESFIQAARSVGLLVAEARRYREALLAVQAPTQVVHGGGDRVLAATGLDQLAELQPSWRTEVLPDVGHSPHLEVPAAVAALVTAATEGDAHGAGPLAHAPSTSRLRVTGTSLPVSAWETGVAAGLPA